MVIIMKMLMSGMIMVILTTMTVMLTTEEG